MPPKLTNLFGKSKVYIGQDLCDIEGLRDFTSKQMFEITKDAITITEETPTPESINTTGTVSITMKLKVNSEKMQKAIDRLLYIYGFRKRRRKTTYKTIRHDCAKRNGRR